MIEPTRQRALALVLATLGVVALASHRGPPQPTASPAHRPPHAAAPLAAAALRDGRPLDLNRATAADLELLPRIGPALAARIVVARAGRGGAFHSVDDLDDVPGIGAKTLACLRRYLVVARPPLASTSAVR